MTDVELSCAALVAAVLALLAPAVPGWLILVLVPVAVALRHPWTLALLLVVVVGWRSHADLAGLVAPRPEPVTTEVTVVTDAVESFGRWNVDVIDGERHESATISRSESEPEVGEHLTVAGRRTPATASVSNRARHISARLTVDQVRSRSGPNMLFTGVNGLRNLLVDGAECLGADRPLFAGLVLGDDSQQTDRLRHDFRASGLAHLLAVSGQNVAFVLVATSPLLGRLQLRSRWVVTVGVLALFTLVTRWEPSVLRAVVMALVAAGASLTGRYASGTRLLSAAVLILLVADPLLVWSTGFRLSVAASAALVALQRPIERRLPFPGWLAAPLATVLAAQIGTAPLLAAMGARLSVASIPANLLAVPVAGWVMVWGLVGGLVAGVAGGPVATLIHGPTGWMLAWIDRVATTAASPRWPSLGSGELLVVAGLVVSMWLTRSTRLRRVVAVTATAILLLVLLRSPPAGRFAPTTGLAIARSPGGSTVVVAGGQVRAGRLLDELTRQQVDHVDLLVLTSSGRSTTATAATVREVTEVGRVLADPALVRGAIALVPGPVRVGDLSLAVRRRGTRWEVDVAPMQGR